MSISCATSSTSHDPSFAVWHRANPAKRLGAKQDGGGRRTRTFEAIRRLIYSQLPLPLGTLPRPNSIETHPLNGGGQAMDDANTVSRWRAPGRPRLWVSGLPKSTNGSRQMAPLNCPNCQNPEPVTQASDE